MIGRVVGTRRAIRRAKTNEPTYGVGETRDRQGATLCQSRVFSLRPRCGCLWCIECVVQVGDRTSPRACSVCHRVCASGTGRLYKVRTRGDEGSVHDGLDRPTVEARQSFARIRDETRPPSKQRHKAASYKCDRRAENAIPLRLPTSLTAQILSYALQV